MIAGDFWVGFGLHVGCGVAGIDESALAYKVGHILVYCNSNAIKLFQAHADRAAANK